MDYFKNNFSKKISFDLPIIVKNNLEKKESGKKNIFKTYWPYIHPTSCITIRKEIAEQLFATISFDRFTDVWMDLRISIFAQYILKSFDIDIHELPSNNTTTLDSIYTHDPCIVSNSGVILCTK